MLICSKRKNMSNEIICSNKQVLFLFLKKERFQNINKYGLLNTLCKYDLLSRLFVSYTHSLFQKIFFYIFEKKNFYKTFFK